MPESSRLPALKAGSSFDCQSTFSLPGRACPLLEGFGEEPSTNSSRWICHHERFFLENIFYFL